MKKLIKHISLTVIIYLSLSFLSFASPVDKEATFTVKQGDKLETGLRMGNISVSISNNNEVRIKGKNIDDDDLSLLTFEKKSGNVYLDDSAFRSIKKSSPLPPFSEYNIREPFFETGIIFPAGELL